MTFNDAAIAYELIQTGCTAKFVAVFFNVSGGHLGNVITDCLINGADSKYFKPSLAGNKPNYTKKTLESVRKMRAQLIPFKLIARKLNTDSERLRKAYNYYDRQTTI